MAEEMSTCKETLDETFSGLLASGDFSDLTITCQGTIFNVHKSVVCFQSRFFRNAVKEGAFKGETGVVDLPDDNPDAVKAMLQFVYSRAYGREDPLCNIDMPLHARTYCLAQRLSLDYLMKYAAGRLEAILHTQHSGLQPQPQPEMWAATVREIYANTAEDDRIRDVIITAALRNLSHLLEEKDGAFSNMMVEFGEFGRDLARATRHAPIFRDETFNPPIRTTTSDEDSASEIVELRCSLCDLYWRGEKQLIYGGNDFICSGCGKGDALLPNYYDQTLFYTRDCDCEDNRPGEKRLWCSKGRDRLVWYCAGCNDFEDRF
ncbi:hypothetical protein EG328_008759 [Venturia inaequalis]|uniref:BTB domain-containing protein n=1 Tax=Venturia inaequalis TaxID=5025 RepID=A0A8H3Z3H2_VENIN|nr:hypothetical protein EG328_008759 [Venturia inaequalis]